MIKISNRLESLEKYVLAEDRIMDVGCDHAILDIHLVQTGKINKIYVCDVNPNALKNGEENIEKYELSGNIFPILSYGIEKIADLPVDTLIISGMGAKNIIDILSSPNLGMIYKLILQANNNHADLRRFLVTNGFRIFDEEIINDGKEYINIVALRDNRPLNYTDLEIEFGPILTTRQENLSYFLKQQENLEHIYYASHTDEVKKKLDYLETIISNLKIDL